MNKYNTHSDLAKESLDLLKEGKHYQRKIEKKEDFSIETYEFLEDTEYLKKGKYIEIFKVITGKFIWCVFWKNTVCVTVFFGNIFFLAVKRCQII